MLPWPFPGFGLPARFVTVLPPDNAISDAFIGELRRFGVDPSFIVRGKGRFGIYFVEAGANQRGSKVLYDREGSSIALAKPGDIDFAKSFEGAGWFHITGITPAISQSAADLAIWRAYEWRATWAYCFLRPELSQESVEVRKIRQRSDERTGEIRRCLHRERRGLPDGAGHRN